MAQEVTVVPSTADLLRWYTPQQARDRAAASLREEHAAAAVWERLREGVIRAFATSSTTRVNYAGSPAVSRTPEAVPHGIWSVYDKPEDRFWAGDAFFSYQVQRELTDQEKLYATIGGKQTAEDTVFVHVFGLRLNPQDVEREFPLPEPAPASAEQSSPKHPGGAPSKPFWEDLWVAVGGLIYRGKITPAQRQGEIEDAMVQWASDHDFDLSKQSARPRARKLLAALKAEEAALEKEDKN